MPLNWTQLPPTVLAQLGEELATTALALSKESGLSAEGRQRVASLESLGLELQALVHSLAGARLASSEAVPLLEAARAARRQWLADLARRNLKLVVVGEAVDVEADPGHVQHAIDLLVGHALASGMDVALAVERDGSGVPVLAVEGQGEGPDPAEVHGQLLQWLSRSVGWQLERASRLPAGKWGLRLVLTAPSGGDVSVTGLAKYHWRAEERVLVMDADAGTRALAARLLREAGLRADCVSSLEQAQASLADGLPDAVVCGLPMDDPRGQAFAARLRLDRPQLRWIELVDAPFVFAAGSTDGAVPARISRSDLPHTLLASLAD